MTKLTSFGKQIKKRLIDIDQNQNWLIDQVKERTGLFFDNSYLHKICTGKLGTPKITQAIRDILEFPEQEKGDTQCPILNRENRTAARGS